MHPWVFWNSEELIGHSVWERRGARNEGSGVDGGRMKQREWWNWKRHRTRGSRGWR